MAYGDRWYPEPKGVGVAVLLALYGILHIIFPSSKNGDANEASNQKQRQAIEKIVQGEEQKADTNKAKSDTSKVSQKGKPASFNGGFDKMWNVRKPMNFAKAMPRRTLARNCI